MLVRAVAFLTLGLAGCAGISVERYRPNSRCSTSHYFNGTIDGWGMFQDRSGEVIKRFTVVIEASWQGNAGTLDEHFHCGPTAPRRDVWTITRDGEGAIVAAPTTSSARRP